MKKKYCIDRVTKEILINYIRKYQDYKAWYESQRDVIFNWTGTKNVMKQSYPSDSVLGSIVKLEEVETNHKTLVVKAIDDAYAKLCDDIQTEHIRLFAKNAVWNSCIDRRMFNYNYYANKGMSLSKRQFYFYKRKFLFDIKTNLKL